MGGGGILLRDLSWTNRMLIDACVEQGRSLEWCREFAGTYTRAKTCGALWKWCEHLGAHGGEGNRHYIEMCVAVYNRACSACADWVRLSLR